MICLGCRALVDGDAATCPRCSGTLARPDRESVDALVRALVDARLKAGFALCERRGLLLEREAVETVLEATRKAGVLVLKAASPEAPAQAAVDAILVAEAIPGTGDGSAAQMAAGAGAAVAAGAVAAGAATVAAAVGAPPPGAAAAVPVREFDGADGRHASDAEHAGATGAQLFGGPGSAATGAMDVFASLDAARARVWPLLYENIGWFIGALLVLAGSVYGVREAWRALGSVERHALVAGALFAYHAAFTALSSLLVRKAASAARVLAIIAAGLLPMVFAALASLIATSPPAGALVSAAVVALTTRTLRSMAGRFELDSPRPLLVALLPALIAQLPLALPGDDHWIRAILPFAGVGALLATVRPGRTLNERLAPLPFALYAWVALEIFARTSGPESLSSSSAPAGFAFAALLLRIALTAASLALLFRGATVRDTLPRLAPGAELFALAALVCTTLLSWASFPGLQPVPLPTALVVAVTCGVAAASFAVAMPAHNAAVHAVVPATTLAAAALARGLSVPLGWWVFGAAIAPAAVLRMSPGLPEAGRAQLRRWSVAFAILAIALSSLLGAPGFGPVLATAVLVAGAAGGAAGLRDRKLHYLAGLAALVAAAAWWLPLRDSATDFVELLLGAAFVFAIAGPALDLLAERKAMPASRFFPYDDLSLAAFFTAALLAGSADASGAAVYVKAGAICLSGAGLLLRSWRDSSRIIPIAGAALLLFGGGLALGQAGLPSGPTFAGLALAAMTVAMLRPPGPAPEVAGRTVLGGLELAWATSGRALYADAFALVALGAAAVAIQQTALAFLADVDGTRLQAVVTAGLLTATALVAFSSHAFGILTARGSLGALAVTAVIAGMGVVAWRMGRGGRAPSIAAVRGTLEVVLLWGAALALRRWGPAIGKRLGDEDSGRSYHSLAHIGVGLVGAVLLGRAIILTLRFPDHALAVVPPLMPFGAALAVMLLARSFGRARWVDLALPLGLLAMALVGAQQGLLGPDFVRCEGGWLPVLQAEAASTCAFAPAAAAAAVVGGAVYGLGAAALLLAVARASLLHAPGAIDRTAARILFGSESDARVATLQSALRTWAVVGAALAAASLWSRPIAPVVLLVLLAGAALVAGRAFHGGGCLVAAGLVGAVHLAASTAGTLPRWAGPLLCLMATAFVLAESALRRRGGRAAAGTAGDVLALATLAFGAAYALATLGGASADRAGAAVLSAAVDGLAGRWATTYAWPLAAGLATLTLGLQALRRSPGSRTASALFATLAALSGAVAVAATLVVLRAGDGALRTNPERLTLALLAHAELIAQLSASLALCAAALHVMTRIIGAEHAPLAAGLRRGRDVLLVGAGVVAALLLPVSGGDAGLRELAPALAALLAAAFVSGHAAWKEHSGLHVYFVQVAAVGLYGLPRGLLAEHWPLERDAVFALVLGFVLIGVTVLARRADIPPVARATRRVAALVPIAIGLLTGFEATVSTALLTGGSALVYGALGVVERNRYFGALGAIAANLAILSGALASGLDGPEAWLAPLGLTVLALGRIFAASLDEQTRQRTRIAGSLLLYVPSAVQIAFQAGNAQNGWYPVVFGLACLAGVGAGMLLHIRAWLALGTGFLALDVVANLIHAGLRDHRVGFLLLSLTGLAILGTMIVVTLRREIVAALAARIRKHLSTWD